jgi:hypothetical protein
VRGTSMAIGFVPEGQHDSRQARSAWRDVRERVQVRRPAFPPSFIFHRLACRKEDRKFSHGGHGDHGGNLSCRSKA